MRDDLRGGDLEIINMVGAFFNRSQKKVSICMPGSTTPRWMPFYEYNVIAQVCKRIRTPPESSSVAVSETVTSQLVCMPADLTLALVLLFYCRTVRS